MKSIALAVIIPAILLSGFLVLTESGNAADIGLANTNSRASNSCCQGTRGNVNGVGIVDLADLSSLVNYLVGGGYVLPCSDAANINGTGIIDLADLSALVNYLVGAGFVLPSCPSTTFTYTQRKAVFDALDSVEALVDGKSPDSIAAALTTFLSSRSEFEAVGQSGTSVFARFKDGRLLMIPNNRFPSETGSGQGAADYTEPDSTVPSGFTLPPRRFASLDLAAARAPRLFDSSGVYQLPSSIQARVINTLSSPCFTSAKTKVMALLGDAGYELASSDGTVPGLLAVHGDAFFYIDAHGGTGQKRGSSDWYEGIWTSSLVSSAGDSAYASMLDSTELVYMEARDLKGGSCVDHMRYAITARFVAQYMTFADNSCVLINACSSWNEDLKDGFDLAHASVYFGWLNSVKDRPSNRAGEFLVDRMLGTNKSTLSPPADPPQRPFDHLSVTTEMENEGVSVDSSNGSYLAAHNAYDHLSMLAPSIAMLYVHPYEQKLYLYGYFGSNPGSDGIVTVDGVSLPIQSWGYGSNYQMDTIVCTIPDTGPGSAGDVQVSVRTIKSNITQLSRYKGKFTLSHETGDGRKYEIVLDLQLRVHLLPFRMVPGKPPTYNQTTYVVNGDMGSTGTYSASGQTNLPDGSSIGWIGSGDLTNNIDGSEADNSYIAGAWFDPEHLKLQFYLSGGVQEGITAIYQDPDGNSSTFPQPIIYGLDQFDGKHDYFPSYVNIPMNPDYSIPEGSSTATAIGVSYSYLAPNGDIIKIKRDYITCEFPPKPDVPRAPEAPRRSLAK